jgi:hypothetical protein
MFMVNFVDPALVLLTFFSHYLRLAWNIQMMVIILVCTSESSGETREHHNKKYLFQDIHLISGAVWYRHIRGIPFYLNDFVACYASQKTVSENKVLSCSGTHKQKIHELKYIINFVKKQAFTYIAFSMKFSLFTQWVWFNIVFLSSV